MVGAEEVCSLREIINARVRERERDCSRKARPAGAVFGFCWPVCLCVGRLRACVRGAPRVDRGEDVKGALVESVRVPGIVFVCPRLWPLPVQQKKKGLPVACGSLCLCPINIKVSTRA